MIRIWVMQFPAGVSHAAYSDSAALKQRLVAREVVADQLARPVSEELASIHTGAAIGKVVDDSLQRRVVEATALYPERTELKAEYPELEDEDIAQALDFAARNLDDQIVPLEAA